MGEGGDTEGGGGEETDGKSPPGGIIGGGKNGEAAVLLHLERCAHRQTRRCLQEMKEKYQSLQQELTTRSIKLGNFNVRYV